MSDNYPPKCICGGEIVWDKDHEYPDGPDTDGTDCPGFVHLRGVCKVCGKKHNLQYIFDEGQCDECHELSEDCRCKGIEAGKAKRRAKIQQKP